MNRLNVPVFNPIIIDIPGPLAVSWYGLMYLCGFVFCYLFLYDHIRRKKILLSNEQVMESCTWILVGVLIGGRLGYTLFVVPEYYLKNPLKIFAVWEGGMYFFGGLIIAALTLFIYARRQKINLLNLSDIIIIPIPIALAFGRLGNFINGEFWGKPSASPLAMIFDSVPRQNWFSPSEPWVKEIIDKTGINLSPNTELVNLPRHPVQLYELLLEGIILYIILLLFRNIGGQKPRGSVSSLFILLYGLFRFWIEFYREPISHSRLIAGDWFTLSMLFSGMMIIVGIMLLVFTYRKHRVNTLYRRS